MTPLRRASTLVAGFAVLALAGCGGSGRSNNALGAEAAVTGLNQVATSKSYLVLLNIVPPEAMFNNDEMLTEHPTDGELIIDGAMAPILPDSRHAEAHIYSLETGEQLTSIRPTIMVNDRTTGVVRSLDVTLMQDVNIGARDLHFGNNVEIPLGHDFLITVRIRDEEVTFSGRLV